MQLAPSFCSSWRYRFLNFTHVVPRFDGVALRGGSTFSFSPSCFSPTRVTARALSLARAFTISTLLCRSFPGRRTPSIVLPSETSFCFTLSLSPWLIICAFCRSCTVDCVRTGELRTWFARSLAGHQEKEKPWGSNANPVKRRRENDGKKSDTIKGVKVDTIERETTTLHAWFIFTVSHPPRAPFLAQHPAISVPLSFLSCTVRLAGENTFAMT